MVLWQMNGTSANAGDAMNVRLGMSGQLRERAKKCEWMSLCVRVDEYERNLVGEMEGHDTQEKTVMRTADRETQDRE